VNGKIARNLVNIKLLQKKIIAKILNYYAKNI
jgi:hypothetical protein